MKVKIGTIAEINRYPVKSFAGERLESCEIAPYGIVGDRHVSFRDETKEGWYRYVTARNIPNMLNYEAKFEDGEILVKSPDGQANSWDEKLLAELQSQTDIRLSMTEPKAPHPEHPHLLSVDGDSILFVTDASLSKLESLWGKPLDPRRFRANFVVALSEEALSEGEWIGRHLSVGEARLKVDGYCERCVVITMDPDTQTKDPSLLRKVNEEFELNFGVLASVIETGSVKIGDKVTIE